MERNKAAFDWLTYELRSPVLLVVSLRTKRRDKVTNEVMAVRRIK